MKNYIKLMRVHHYLKNLLVFMALACSGHFFDGGKLSYVFASFVAFCMISSVVYVINDIRDVEKDRRHPTKCNRPIASGAVSPRYAIVLAVILTGICIMCNALAFNIWSSALILIYFIINLAYSFGLKNVPLVDVTILVAGFFIRIMYGAVIAGIEISNWLYLTVLTFAFYFALGKRRNELRNIGTGETRAVLKAYTMAFLDKNMYMCLTLGNAFYALWSMDTHTQALYHSRYMVLTVPIVLLITMKYNLSVEAEADGDPIEVLIHDKALLGLTLLYLVTMFSILYLQG